MDLWHSFGGMITVKVMSADTAGFLGRLQQSNIALCKVQFLNELELQFQIRRSDSKAVERIADKSGAKVSVCSYDGVYWKFLRILQRPALLLGLSLLLVLTAFIPTRIFFVSVEGNRNVPVNLILYQAENCGISFGVSRREIRSEKVKNALLQSIPELEWVGINTAGCVATISVRERQQDKQQEQGSGVSSIVAATDGVIAEMSVVAGNPMVQKGSAVKNGQVLISGYTDCGLSIRATRAKGEIYARTKRKIAMVAPISAVTRGEITSKTRKFAIIIGKNRINFYQGSGILDTSCVKMYEEKYVTLPGGFQLPIAFVSETWIYYEESTPVDGETQDISALAESYLTGHMIAGKILEKNESTAQINGVLHFQGEYTCHEMIGQERNEEIITP